MASIHSKNTKPENQLARLLKKNHISFKKQYLIVGKPDFVIISKKIAIFVDGDFWHGHNWKLRGIKNLKTELSTYKKYWSNKIQTNIKRDKKVNKILIKSGWKIIRIWESDLKKNPQKILSKILQKIHPAKPNL